MAVIPSAPLKVTPPPYTPPENGDHDILISGALRSNPFYQVYGSGDQQETPGNDLFISRKF